MSPDGSPIFTRQRVARQGHGRLTGKRALGEMPTATVCTDGGGNPQAALAMVTVNPRASNWRMWLRAWRSLWVRLA